MGGEGPDFFEGMGEANVEDTELYFSDVEASRAKCESDSAEMLTADTKLGLAPGPDGWWDDGVAHVSPWGFELHSISTPVLLVHGREDRFVPFAHGQWLAAHVPGVEARLTDDDGHLTLLTNHLDEVYAWLLARL